MITGPILRKVVPNLSEARADEIVLYLEAICPGYNLYTPGVMHEFLATIAHESGGFRIKAENMNYSAQRIVEVWPSRFKTVLDAKPYEYNRIKLANKVYGGRMGNNLINDGYDFRGSGFIQLTGRASAEAYARWWSMDDPLHLMELLRTDDWWALDSACWEFAIDKKLIQLAKADQFETITKRINGGLIGWTSRLEFYERAKRYIT